MDLHEPNQAAADAQGVPPDTQSTPFLQTLGQVALVASTAYILFFYAEALFWMGTIPDDPLGYIAWRAPTYLLGAFILLGLVKTMRVRRRHAVILAAAFCGWIVEAMAYPPRYESAAVRTAFAGLAWNAMLGVFAGWYAIPHLIQFGRRRDVAAAAVAIGILWGLWAIGWRVSPGVHCTPPLIFLAAGLLSTVALITAYRLYLAAAESGFILPPGSLPAAFALALAGIALAAIRSRPDLLLVLPIFLFATYAALRKNRRLERHRSIISRAPAPILHHQDLYLMLMPLAAGSVYFAATIIDLGIATHPAIFAVAAPVSLGALAWSIATAMRRKTGRRTN